MRHSYRSLLAVASAAVLLCAVDLVWAQDSAGSKTPASGASSEKESATDADPATDDVNRVTTKLDADTVAGDGDGDGDSADTQSVESPPPSTYDLVRQQNGEPIEERSLTSQLVRTVLALGVVIGLIYLIFKLGLGRLLQAGGMPKFTSAAERQVRVLERTPIDPKNALYLVEIGGERRILVGGGERGTTFLCEVDGLPSKKRSDSSSVDQASFAEILAKTDAQKEEHGS